VQSLLAGFQLVKVYERELIAMAAEVTTELRVGAGRLNRNPKS